MIKRSRIVLLVIILLVAGAIGYLVMRPAPIPVAVTARVEKGSLAQTVEVTGTVETINDVSLAFNASGTVDSIAVAVGDTVVAGETLASLNADDLSAAVAQARDSVTRAQAELDAKLAGVSSEQVAVAQADVAVAQATLSAAQADELQAKAVQDAAVISAEQSLAQAKTDTARTLSSSREDLVESARSTVAEVRHALADADTVLGIENTLYNQTFEDMLGNEGSQTVLDATNAFAVAARSRDAAEAAFLAMDASTDSSVSSVVVLVEQSYRDASETLLQTARVLDATVSDSADFSLDDTKAYKTTIASSLSTLISNGTALTNAKQSLADAQAALTDDVSSSTNALATARATRDRAEATAASAVASRSADLVRANASLASLIVAPRNVDVASLRASIAAAQADLAGAVARLQKTQVIAPIDGIVTAIAFDAGESASAGVTAITVLSSGTAYEVSMDVPESDVSKISVGNAAGITFDALGDARAFEGAVVKIDPAQKLIEGVVYYEATVSLAAGQDLSLVRPGMSSNVTVRAAERADAISVPSRSVLAKDGYKYVRLQAADGTIEERTVMVGLHADGGRTEILSGLEEGEAVVVSLSKP
ncbi:MAG: efflux RND transporter periplasmic adaptor subunit [Candidatus Uhrbacteria bacterium]